jgi:hypothetical protein
MRKPRIRRAASQVRRLRGTGLVATVGRLVNVERSDAINVPAYLYTLSLNNASPLHVGPATGYYRWALQQCCNP